jgi:hypothetical protein
MARTGSAQPTAIAQSTLALTGNNTTVHAPVFHIIGSVEIIRLWGLVTTAVGVNHTAASWRLNDQTAVVAITSAAGTTLSAVAAGSVIVKKDVASAAVTLINNSAGRINEPTTLETSLFSEFTAVKKTAATTDIEYNYTTTDAPTTGVIQHFCEWRALSADGAVVGV